MHDNTKCLIESRSLSNESFLQKLSVKLENEVTKVE